MKTLSQISEDLYQLQVRMLGGGAISVCQAMDLGRIRQDLEPHITSRAAHDTPGEGTVYYSLDGSLTEP